MDGADAGLVTGGALHICAIGYESALRIPRFWKSMSDSHQRKRVPGYSTKAVILGALQDGQVDAHAAQLILLNWFAGDS